MPTYKITAPDGKSYRVTAPEGSAPEQVMTYFRSNYAKTAAKYAVESARQERGGAKVGDPLQEMNTGEKALANIGAGFSSFGRGVGQLFGTADEQDEAQAREVNQPLADSMTGGGLLQVAGEALPYVGIPGGAVARGLAALPKVGAGLKAAGVGSRALPTLIAEGAALGGTAGALTPTVEGESATLNALLGAAGGAAIPSAMAGVGKAYRMSRLPGAKSLQERRVARELASDAGGRTAEISKKIDKGLKQPRVTETPSTAVLTQDPRLAATELEYRARPEFTASWQRMDEASNRARWDALDNTLGNKESVEAAKNATNEYSVKNFPGFAKSVDKKKLLANSVGFDQEVNRRLALANRNADPDAKEVYGYLKRVKSEGAKWSVQSLWKVRQTLDSWVKGAPPAGSAQVRSDKIEPVISEVRKAIDNMLDNASSKKWSKFKEGLAEHLQKETTQKSGQNIRNAFIDEELGVIRKPSSAGDPSVTRAALTQAYSKFGKNRFGQTLDWPQEDAVTQVLGDLQGQEILNNTKKSMTGGGGSQTAPLLGRLATRGLGQGGGDVMAVLDRIRGIGANRQREIVNEMLQNPAYARELLSLAQDQASPLTRQQRLMIMVASRAGATLPLAVSGGQ